MNAPDEKIVRIETDMTAHEIFMTHSIMGLGMLILSENIKEAADMMTAILGMGEDGYESADKAMRKLDAMLSVVAADHGLTDIAEKLAS